MKVLAVIVTPPVYKSSGGVAAGLALTRALVGKVEVEAATMAATDGEYSDGGLRVRQFCCTSRLGPFYRLVPRPLATGMWRSRIPAYIVAHRPDLVHIHNPMPPLALCDVTRACYHAGIPYVISSHGFVEMTGYAAAYGIGRAKRALLRPLVTAPFRDAVRHATAICMLSPFEREMMHELNVSDDKLFVVTNGATSYFASPASEGERDDIVRRFGAWDDRPTFLFVGNHTRNKGIDLLLEAAHHIDIPLRIVVAGAVRSRGEYEALRRQCKVDQLGDRVIFTDHVTDAELRVLYQSVDAFVFPTRADTLPLVVLEAMVSGLPVIATCVGGIPYQVTPETGILLPPNDAAALASAMTMLARDPDKRRAMGEAGHRRAVELFNWDRAGDAAVMVYKKIWHSQNGLSISSLGR